MAKEELSVPGTLVKKSNSIVRTRISVQSVEASRILAHLVACIRVDEKRADVRYSVPAKDIIPYLGGDNYRHIKATCKELAGAFAESEEPDSEGAHPEYTVRPFFSELKYKRGVITAMFNPVMKDYLFELKSCFTTYNLTEYLSLPSIYSQRIFEITKSLANSQNGEAIISMADLHRFLDSPASLRANFKDFRIRVLEKAHKDITGLTSLRYEWEPVKKGRAVVAVRFIFSRRRALPVAKAKEAEAQAKGSTRNNRAFQAAVACAERKGQCCTQQDNKPGVCAVCVKLGICKEIALRLV